MGGAEGLLGEKYDVEVDSFIPPDRRAEPIKRIIGGKNFTITGPITYGESTVKFALEVASSAASNESAALIKALESLIDSDFETFQFDINMQDKVGDTAISTYTLSMEACRLTGLKVDDLDRQADDNLVSVNITFQPGRVSRMSGGQIG